MVTEKVEITWQRNIHVVPEMPFDLNKEISILNPKWSLLSQTYNETVLEERTKYGRIQSGSGKTKFSHEGEYGCGVKAIIDAADIVKKVAKLTKMNLPKLEKEPCEFRMSFSAPPERVINKSGLIYYLPDCLWKKEPDMVFKELEVGKEYGFPVVKVDDASGNATIEHKVTNLEEILLNYKRKYSQTFRFDISSCV